MANGSGKGAGGDWAGVKEEAREQQLGGIGVKGEASGELSEAGSLGAVKVKVEEDVA